MAEQQAHMLAEQRYGQTGGWEYARRSQGPAFAYDYERRVPWGAAGCPSYGWQGPPMGEYGGYPGQGYQPEFVPGILEGRGFEGRGFEGRGFLGRGFEGRGFEGRGFEGRGFGHHHGGRW